MPRLEIELKSSLLIAGGRSAGMGVNQATVCRRSEKGDTPYIPATALRGAVRIQLEALLRGAAMAVTGPFPREEAEPSFQPADVVARLFGYSGGAMARDGSRQGILRFSDATPLDPEEAAARMRVRAGVSIDRYTASAANQRLYFRQECAGSAESLMFKAELNITGSAEPEDLLFLRNAVTSTQNIGAGKSSGGGNVSIKWKDSENPAVNRVLGDPSTASRARVVCTLMEPAVFGDGGMIGNHRGSERYLRGSTLRGAVAWALLNANRCKPEDEAFVSMFLDDNPVSFGDGLPIRGPELHGKIRPATRRKPRHADVGKEIDILIDELARRRLNRLLQDAGDPRYLRPQYEGYRQDSVPARETDDLVRRTRTRVCLDRYTGAAAPEKLFSYEYLDRWFAGPEKEKPVPVRFEAWIENLDPDSAELLSRLRHATVFVGSSKHTGHGLVQLEVNLEPAPTGDDSKEKIESLAALLEEKVRKLAAVLDLEVPKQPEAKPLVLVARSPYLPHGPDDHPLRDWEERYGRPEICFRNRETVGGYNQRPDKKKGDYFKPLYQAVGAGSVFVYYPQPREGPHLARGVATALRIGVGKERALGCGRFTLFEEENNESTS